MKESLVKAVLKFLHCEGQIKTALDVVSLFPTKIELNLSLVILEHIKNVDLMNHSWYSPDSFSSYSPYGG